MLLYSQVNIEEVRLLDDKEKKLSESLMRAVTLLPEGKRDYLMGYADGVAAMAEAAREKTGEVIAGGNPQAG